MTADESLSEIHLNKNDIPGREVADRLSLKFFNNLSPSFDFGISVL